MKKLREMKENNKGFSLVELIVVIAIMVVLIAVLGSAILGYVEKANHSKDIQALDAVDTAMGLLIADPNSDYSAATTDNGCSLKTLMDKTENKVLGDTLAEVFNEGVFQSSSDAFDGLTTENVQIHVSNGVVSIMIPVLTKYSGEYDPYVSGTKWADDATSKEKYTFAPKAAQD